MKFSLRLQFVPTPARRRVTRAVTTADSLRKGTRASNRCIDHRKSQKRGEGFQLRQYHMLLNMSIRNCRKKEKPGILEAGGHTLPRHPAAEARGFPEAEHLREGRGDARSTDARRWPEGAALFCPFGKERTAADTRKGASGCIPGPNTGNLHRQACPLDATRITGPYS